MNSVVWSCHSRISLEPVYQLHTQCGNTLIRTETVKVKVILELHVLQ